MRKIIILFIIALSLQGFCQDNQLIEIPKVDKRVELLSIVFRLAGNREYNDTRFKLYTDKIEQHFTPYKNHELIKFAEKLRNESGISYDAVVSMAIHIDENLNPRTDFTENTLEGRWSKDDADKFVKLLQSFYKEAKCEEFFKDNEDIYHEATVRFLHVYDSLDPDWYSSFYGEKLSEKFIIIIGVGNGGNHYGVSFQISDSEKEVYAIMGAWDTDDSGMVDFDNNSYFPYLIHEFNHSFINTLLDKNKVLFRNNGEKIMEKLEDEMRAQAYANWETVLNEALVRASVIKYLIDHDFNKTAIEVSLENEISNSFLWIRELVGELEKYDTQRSLYPTLSSYMPKIAEAYNSYSETIIKFDAQRPKVESVKEFVNGDLSVDASIKTITIIFDMPLSGKGYSIFPGAKGQQALPSVSNISYTNDNKSVVMEVQLLPDNEYQFILTGKNFKTIEGHALKSYEVNFKTAK